MPESRASEKRSVILQSLLLALVLVNIVLLLIRESADNRPVDPREFPGGLCDIVAQQKQREGEPVTVGWYRQCVGLAEQLRPHQDNLLLDQ